MKRNKRMIVLLSREERKDFEAAAREQRLILSEWVRAVLNRAVESSKAGQAA